ncbi:EamA family transporter [Microbacterium sp. M28]|uniref:EamA family transporter n=1 Tax=Microbacterium sp. M28 TaxID=2962064 RepID=UPI0021F487A8|nr:EamA family transporter [Microbacterium sp. M28]UYO97692.1 EamA family transporter [Microbacterium sp. M28]
MLPFGVPAALVVFAEPSLLLLAAATALLGSIIPYTLELAALRRVPQRVFGILLSLEPATATLAGWLLLHQQAGPVRLAAIAFVIAASIGVSISGGRGRGRGRGREAATEAAGPLSDPATP